MIIGINRITFFVIPTPSWPPSMPSKPPDLSFRVEHEDLLWKILTTPPPPPRPPDIDNGAGGTIVLRFCVAMTIRLPSVWCNVYVRGLFCTNTKASSPPSVCENVSVEGMEINIELYNVSTYLRFNEALVRGESNSYCVMELQFQPGAISLTIVRPSSVHFHPTIWDKMGLLLPDKPRAMYRVDLLVCYFGVLRWWCFMIQD